MEGVNWIEARGQEGGVATGQDSGADGKSKSCQDGLRGDNGRGEVGGNREIAIVGLGNLPGLPESDQFMDREVVDQVKQANDILDVVQGCIGPMKRQGANYVALSPFQKEKTPSFNVLPDRQIFKCFSSGHGGDVIRFVMLYENLEFMAAVRQLAERAGIRLPEERNPGARQERSRREQLLEIHGEVALWWKTLLWKEPAGAPGREYLQKRRIGRSLAEEFGLGYSLDSWNALLDWGRERGYSAEILEAAGLVSINEKGRRYDRFRGRLMFPIEDEGGRVIAFSGRVLDPDAKAAKYMNSPETDIFHKSKVLYGLGKTKQAIMGVREVVICEGQIDLMRCYEQGIKHVVAPLGTSFTGEHGKLLKRFADKVTLCFDSDRAGQAAAERSVDTLLESGLDIRIAGLPPGQDPDSLLLGPGREDFLASLDDSPDYVTHILEAACRNTDISSPRVRGEVAAKMAGIVLNVTDPVARHALSLGIASRLQVPLAAFEGELEKVQAGREKKRRYEMARAATAEDETAAMLARKERVQAHELVDATLALLLNHMALIPEVARRLDPAWVDELEGAHLLTKLFELHGDDALHDASAFLNSCDPAECDYVAGVLAAAPPASGGASQQSLASEGMAIRKELLVYYQDTSETPEQMADRLLAKARELWTQRRVALIEQQIKAGNLAAEELTAKFSELVDLKKACL